MVHISALIVSAVTLLGGQALTMPSSIQHRQPNPEIFSFDLFTDCSQAVFIPPNPSNVLFLSDAGKCFNQSAVFGDLAIESYNPPTGETCEIFTFTGLGCTGAGLGPFNTAHGGKCGNDNGYTVPGSQSFNLTCVAA